MTACYAALVRYSENLGCFTSPMQYRIAQLSDSVLLATMNQQLIQDENHRNLMNITELQQRMAEWLAGQYQAIIQRILF